jgi:hypothetical protein
VVENCCRLLDLRPLPDEFFCAAQKSMPIPRGLNFPDVIGGAMPISGKSFGETRARFSPAFEPAKRRTE